MNRLPYVWPFARRSGGKASIAFAAAYQDFVAAQTAMEGPVPPGGEVGYDFLESSRFIALRRRRDSMLVALLMAPAISLAEQAMREQAVESYAQWRGGHDPWMPPALIAMFRSADTSALAAIFSADFYV